jgi:hypothetical protein
MVLGRYESKDLDGTTGSPFPFYRRLESKEERPCPTKAKDVAKLERIAPFRKDDTDMLAIGTDIRNQYHQTPSSILQLLVSPDLRDKFHTFTDAIQAAQIYFEHRIQAILAAVHDRPIRFESHRGSDNRIVYHDKTRAKRIAAIVIAQPGYLDWSEFQPVIANSDDEEGVLFNNIQTDGMPVLKLRAAKVISQVRELYNDYGCPNIAVFDYYGIHMVDLRPMMRPNPLQKLARIAYVNFYEDNGSWRKQQDTILGFVERGFRWGLGS